MAKELSPLQKAALDLMIEYKKVDDSFIGAIGDAFEDAGKAVANVATCIAHANPNVQAVVTATIGTAAVAVAGPGAATIGTIAQGALFANDAGGPELGSSATAAAESAATSGTTAPTTTLEDLIKLRHGLR